MYSGGFYPFETPEEQWAYWSRYVYCNRYQDAPKDTYQRLFSLVKDKDYFVLTTNVDHQFQRAGFDEERMFCTQGDFGLFQCSQPCHDATYENEAVIREMVARQHDRKIPTELVPRCPKCGRPMSMNLRADDTFAEDPGWHRACKRCDDFLSRHEDSAILLLELGVGFNTPGIIKYPFWQMTARNPGAVYCCINRGEAVCPAALGAQAICIDGDIDGLL